MSGFVWLAGGKHTWAVEHDEGAFTIVQFISVAARNLLLAGERPMDLSRLTDPPDFSLASLSLNLPSRFLVDLDMNTRTFRFLSEMGEICATGAVPDPCYFAVWTKMAGGRFVLVSQ